MNDRVYTIGEGESARIRRFLRGFAAATVAFVVLVILAIVLADRWIVLISHESERRFIEPYFHLAENEFLSGSDPELQAYVDNLAREISAHMDLDEDLQLEFRVLGGSTVNAFAMLGGHIIVFEGLLDHLDNENSLAMVLAHEIAHARNRDPLLGAGRGVLLQIMISSLSGGGVDPGTVNAGSELMLNTYSREQERDADRLALAALQERYGHVGGATQLFEKLRSSEAEADTLEILSSHPNLDRRIDEIEAAAAGNGWARRPTVPYPPEIRARFKRQP